MRTVVKLKKKLHNYSIIKENLGNCKYNLYNKIDFVENTYGNF